MLEDAQVPSEAPTWESAASPTPAAGNDDGALMDASSKGSIVKAYVRVNEGLSALHCAAFSGQEVVVTLLLNHGADADLKAENGNTPLHLAIFHFSEAMVELQLKNTADIDSRDNRNFTPLLSAAATGREAKAECLLKHDVDVASRDGRGWTPLHWAAIRGHEAMVSCSCSTAWMLAPETNWVKRPWLGPLDRVVKQWCACSGHSQAWMLIFQT